MLALFRREARWLGRDGGSVWFRHWQEPNPRHHWLVVAPFAFAHYRMRLKDGVRVLDEIAVAPEAREQGLGRLLLARIGRPIELKTDWDNVASNAFYRRLGLSCVEQKSSRRGDRLFNVYRGA